MAERNPSDGRIRFGAFEVDLVSQELFRDGRRIPLANQSFVALAALLEQPGQLVSREALRRRIWPDNRVVEFDQGLNAVINRLREALGSAPGAETLIETLPRRGYRFTGILIGEEPTRPRNRALIFGLVSVLALVAVISMAYLAYGSRAATATLKVEPLTSLIGREVAPALTSDGQHLLFAWDGDPDSHGLFELYSKDLGSERLIRVTRNPATALHGIWSPRAGQLAIARQTAQVSGVYVSGRTGDSERLLVPASFLDESFMQLNWSPDGRTVAYAAVQSDGRSHISLIQADGAKRRVLDHPAPCIDAGLPAFSPDGGSLASVCTSSVAVYQVYVMDLASGAARSLSSLQGNPRGLAWTSSGDALIVVNDSGTESGIWRVTVAGQLSRLTRAEGPLGPGVAVASGHIAFVRENPIIDIWRADLRSSNPSDSALISSTRTDLVPEYSPDGARVAFESTRSGSPEIWLADADGRNPVRVTALNGPLTGAPTWCSDGRRIAYDSRQSGASAIYVTDVFERRPRRLETSTDNLALPVWSQDCRWIIASDGRSVLYRVPASGGPAERFTQKRAYRALVSGTRVIFNVAGENGVELWSKPIEGGTEGPLAGMVGLRNSDSWTASPRGVYYTSSGPQSATINFYDFASHAARVIRTLEVPSAPLGGLGISVSNDGHWLLYTRAGKSDADIMMTSGN